MRKRKIKLLSVYLSSYCQDTCEREEPFRMKQPLLPLLTIVAITGCASQAQHLRSQPVTYMDITGDSNRKLEVLLPPLDDPTPRPIGPQSSIDARIPAEASSLPAPPPPLPPAAAIQNTVTNGLPTAGDVPKLMIRCVRTPEFYNKDTSTRSQCLYESIDEQDLLNLPVRNKTERNRIIDVVASISERNCRIFRDRVFANKAALDATKNTGKDIATGLAAGTVRAAAGFSSAVGIFNLIGGSAVTNINQVLFSDKTFDVISAAIDAERAKWKTTLNLGRRQAFDDYSYQAALDDLQSYDLACSIESALDHLGALAEDDRKAQTATLAATRGSELDQLHQELDNLRTQRQADQDLLKQAQKRLLDTKDEKERAALEAQIKDLRDQVTGSTNALRTLQTSIHAATTTPEAPASTPPVAPPTVTPTPPPTAPPTPALTSSPQPTPTTPPQPTPKSH
jgi:hypothetical protein